MKLKISRLFHWLYAVLMFLPLVMFLPSCLYYSLNKYATNETTTTINYKYQSNYVSTLNDLVEGNIYHFELINGTLGEYLLFSNENSNFSITFINIQQYDFQNFSTSLEEIMTTSYENNGYMSLTIDMYPNSWYVNYYPTTNENNDYLISLLFEDIGEHFTLVGDFIYQGSYLVEFDSVCISETDYNVIDYVEINVQDTISNKMYLAWESIWNLPLFAWTKNSFITAPFSYITGLFGLSSDNSLNCVFTYFASISICWLVFDLIMYVPNLAHRWLDRSAIE